MSKRTILEQLVAELQLGEEEARRAVATVFAGLLSATDTPAVTIFLYRPPPPGDPVDRPHKLRARELVPYVAQAMRIGDEVATRVVRIVLEDIERIAREVVPYDPS